MNGNGQISRCTLVAAVFLAVAAVPAGAGQADVFSELRTIFGTAYGNAAQFNLKLLRKSVPILVNRFEQIALYRPGREKPNVYTMDMAQYSEATEVSHAAAAIYAALVPYGYGKLDRDRRQWLKDFRRPLRDAAQDVQHRPDIPPELKRVQLAMLASMTSFVDATLKSDSFDQAGIDAFARSVQPGIRDSLDFAAESQLSQFRKQLDRWKQDYPQLAWDKAVVVVMAGHQPRAGNLQQQFFDWAFHDTPVREDSVVYAETQKSPPPLTREPREALVLLSKVMLDKGFAATMFSDKYGLQGDVLGPPAKRIIDNWRGAPPAR